MANHPVYNNTTNGVGERVSTNGYWTGHQVGTVMQDASAGAVNQPYSVEGATIHVGTLLQDERDTNFPTVVE